jgi:hypothetical protein
MLRDQALCKVMQSGDGPAVAVVDFAEFSARGTIAELIQRDFAGHPVLRVDAVSTIGADLRGMELDELALLCAHALRDAAPALVVGYCSAAGLAVRTAAALAGSGRPPRVVLVEPTWLTAGDVREALDGLRGSLGAQERFNGALDLHVVLPVLRDDLVGNLVAQGVAEHELNACVELLLPRYEAWFSFLLLTLRGAAGPGDYDDVHIVVGRDTDTTTAPTPVRLAVDAADVAQSEVTSAAIRDLLAAHATPR